MCVMCKHGGEEQEAWKKILALNMSLVPDYKVLMSHPSLFISGLRTPRTKQMLMLYLNRFPGQRLIQMKFLFTFPCIPTSSTHTPQNLNQERKQSLFLNTNFEPTIKTKPWWRGGWVPFWLRYYGCVPSYPRAGHPSQRSVLPEVQRWPFTQIRPSASPQEFLCLSI